MFAHTDYDFNEVEIGFEVFRFEDGQAVEHWDNLQSKPAGPNPSGHTMLDGPTEAEDLDKVHSSFYDLFRIANGKIVEHWDTTEAVPPRSEWVNDNGKF